MGKCFQWENDNEMKFSMKICVFHIQMAVWADKHQLSKGVRRGLSHNDIGNTLSIQCPFLLQFHRGWMTQVAAGRDSQSSWATIITQQKQKQNKKTFLKQIIELIAVIFNARQSFILSFLSFWTRMSSKIS